MEIAVAAVVIAVVAVTHKKNGIEKDEKRRIYNPPLILRLKQENIVHTNNDETGKDSISFF